MIQVNVRMGVKDKAKAMSQAKKLGVSLSAYIRVLINGSKINIKKEVTNDNTSKRRNQRQDKGGRITSGR